MIDQKSLTCLTLGTPKHSTSLLSLVKNKRKNKNSKKLPNTFLTASCQWSHCVKSVQIRSYFWSVFSYIRTEYGDLLRRDTEYLSVFSPNTGKYGPEIAPYLDTFHAGLYL